MSGNCFNCHLGYKPDVKTVTDRCAIERKNTHLLLKRAGGPASLCSRARDQEGVRLIQTIPWRRWESRQQRPGQQNATVSPSTLLTQDCVVKYLNSGFPSLWVSACSAAFPLSAPVLISPPSLKSTYYSSRAFCYGADGFSWCLTLLKGSWVISTNQGLTSHPSSLSSFSRARHKRLYVLSIPMVTGRSCPSAPGLAGTSSL